MTTELDYHGYNLRGIPESWLCIDCGTDTAPGVPNRAGFKRAVEAAAAAGTADQGIQMTRPDHRAEVYTVRKAVWTKAGMEGWGGCLCVGCLEKRLGRRLKPKDFWRDHPFNDFPGTARLLDRQKRRSRPR
jgi:hypothetical protein